MGKKILVVDDALFMRRVIRKNLEGSAGVFGAGFHE